MLEIKDITKKYGKFTAVEKINVSLESSSIFGLVGYNGAGKTTLLKTVAGIFKPEEGEVLLDGIPVYENTASKARMFMIPDDPFILPQANMKKMAKFYGGYYPGWNWKLFEKLSGIFKLDINKRINAFSKGMQRQAFIIFALSSSADCLLMDEAFDGIDPMMRDLVRQLLLETIAERGTTAVISSHNLRELEDLCDRVGVLNGKQIAYDANIEDMRMSRNKYRVAFANASTELGFEVRNLKRDGNIFTFIAEGSSDEIKQKLTEKSPLLLEVLPLSLEEIFLIEMEAQTYDFTDLFQ